MELRHLRYFVAVADAGSLTVAAEQMDVGTQLVGRSAQGVELTSAGKAFRHAWHWSRRKPPRKRPCTQLTRPNRHSLSASCRVRTNLLILVFASDHHLASHVAVPPREIANETFCLPSRSAPAARRAVLEYFSGLASISSRHMRCIMSYMPYP
jgi:hypothetical protein